MTSAAIELQKAIFATLTADTDLTTQLGGARIFDHAPANVAFPYLTFGRTSVFDWSTSTDDGNEHIFTVHVWSKSKGKGEALEIAARVKAVLHDADLSLGVYHLVSLRQELEEVRFNDDHAVYHGLLRYRATTEVQTS